MSIRQTASSFRALSFEPVQRGLSGRRKCTVRRHKFNKDSLSSQVKSRCAGGGDGRGDRFSNILLNVGQLLRNWNCLEVPQQWTFRTISFRWTNHIQQSGMAGGGDGWDDHGRRGPLAPAGHLTSLIQNREPLGPYSRRTMPRALWCP